MPNIKACTFSASNTIKMTVNIGTFSKFCIIFLIIPCILTKVSEVERENWIKMHNDVRRRVAKGYAKDFFGNSLEGASNMNKLVGPFFSFSTILNK